MVISACALTLERSSVKMATSTGQSGSVSVEQCEEYIEKHGIQSLLKECIAKICQEQPANPYKWLSAYFGAMDTKTSKASLLPPSSAVGDC